MARPNERPTANARYFETAFEGPGWYWWAAEYPEDGSVGMFKTFESACSNAVDSGYVVSPIHDGRMADIAASRAKPHDDDSDARLRVRMLLRILSHRRGHWEPMESDVDDVLRAVRGMP